ncbi:hypothetical protein [Paenibacillus polymyxa]|uniref:Uncharacterized protein n=1 Tax=Paenibacillus polymyxa TaxID=1406 RepID=A0A378Y0L8_PAEPO|nr:hypothetical protein [Paenibacillus polymyxa]MBE7901072.1 hypothetical protein [Paenibacillus polymyxa]MBG9765070.1 hypothetical protein [Paenibacillus polymyxa]MCC3261573.1 hypothetical protein [Paenibacillus polymyxa]MEE4578817.1 hypothetical protein [Paenibacillus polymyxa]QPK54975.1 hypothetical protein G7035_21205 [Paenibacillus polymyxa]
MSQYLELTDSDFVPVGIKLTTPLILRASAVIDGRCKREIGVTTYTERIPLTDQQRGHLSYYPVVEVKEVKGRPKQGLMGNFFGPPGFETITDTSTIDIDKDIGTVWCGFSPFGSAYAELEVTYTSGWETIPDKVKVACGLIIGQLAANPNSNVKSKKDFDYSIEYFGNSMITPEIADLLYEFEHRSFR